MVRVRVPVRAAPGLARRCALRVLAARALAQRQAALDEPTVRRVLERRPVRTAQARVPSTERSFGA